MPRGMRRGQGVRSGRGWMHGKFQECGYRLTVPRQMILDELGTIDGHPSAEEIYHRVHRVHPNIGLTTVYRTLELLVQMGIVTKFDFGDGRARYELAESPDGKDHHHHLVCTGCHRVIDYTDFVDEELELLTRTQERLSEKFNFTIDNHMVRFYGLCGRCRRRKKS